MSVKLTFLDTETTGLQPENHAIIQYCLATWEDGVVTEVATRHVLPPTWVSPAPGAVGVNGYDHDKWRALGATPWNEEDAAAFHRFCDGAMMAGANVGFDQGFVSAEFSRMLGAPDAPKWSHRTCDVQDAGTFLVLAGGIEKPSLAELAKFFGVENPNAHDACADVETTIKVFEKMAEYLVFQRQAMHAALQQIASFSPGSGAGELARDCLAQVRQ